MANLRYSITSLKKKIVKDDDHFGAPINIFFICSAPILINDLDPANLLTNSTAFDMYVLRNQNIVLTTTWMIAQTITMNFANCIKEINDRFSQMFL